MINIEAMEYLVVIQKLRVFCSERNAFSAFGRCRQNWPLLILILFCFCTVLPERGCPRLMNMNFFASWVGGRCFQGFTSGDISIAWLISIYFSSDCWVCTNYLITNTKYGPARPTWCNCLNLGDKF